MKKNRRPIPLCSARLDAVLTAARHDPAVVVVGAFSVYQDPLTAEYSYRPGQFEDAIMQVLVARPETGE